MDERLIDISISVAALRGDAAIRSRLAGVVLVLSIIVIGELYHGAFVSARPLQQINHLVALIGTAGYLPCDVGTAAAYGHVRQVLRKQGTPIPENDVWIAAQALQHGLPLATRDGHFKHVPGLVVEQW